MRLLTSRARRSNLRRVEQVKAVLTAAGEGRLEENERRRAAELVHQILGSAGTFGYPRASDLAGRLEGLLRAADLSDAELLGEARATLAALRNELAGGRADGPREH